MKRSLLILLCLALTLAARAALPPLSAEERRDQASEIVSGTIMNVKETVQEVPGGDDRVYQLNVRVDEVKKGMLRPGLTITAICHQTGRRPEGWAGPQGQNEIPAEKSKVRLFMREQDNQFFLLEPNGWEPL